MTQTPATVTITTDFGWYMLMDPAGADRELPLAEGELPPPVGGANGLVGKPYPWRATIATGIRRDDVEVTVEVLSAPPAALPSYDDIVETDYTVLSGTVYVLEEFGQMMLELRLPAGDYRLRVHARGRRGFGHPHVDSLRPAEKHLLQLFPSSGTEGEVVLLTVTT
jgi:hypothetical protein